MSHRVSVSSSSSDTTAHKRGQWDNARRLAAIDAMLRFRPFKQRQQNSGYSWANIFESVNNTSPNLGLLGLFEIRDEVCELVDEVEENIKSSWYVFETVLKKKHLNYYFS